jgi:hypothetical protein
VLTLLGVLLGVRGTLLMCRAYHPFQTSAVVWPILKTVGRVLRGDIAALEESVEATSDLASLNQENRARTLAGVYLLIFSFFLQTLGAMLLVADAWMTRGK